ncbi:MAG: 50S ribosomal protein L15 [SAR324 cluster bacterium]|nr:50S ribosomal protein L15 [SAR324 cluster bacterium]
MLHKLEKPLGSTRKARRKGRGPGSTFGKTAGRGQKGQGARGKVRRGFEGGQTPLHRRLPRRGFTNIFKEQFSIINLDDLVKRPALAEKSEVGVEELVEANAIRNARLPVKVLANGELNRAVKGHAHRFSRAAADKIKAAGGEAVIIEG